MTQSAFTKTRKDPMPSTPSFRALLFLGRFPYCLTIFGARIQRCHLLSPNSCICIAAYQFLHYISILYITNAELKSPLLCSFPLRNLLFSIISSFLVSYEILTFSFYSDVATTLSSSTILSLFGLTPYRSSPDSDG